MKLPAQQFSPASLSPDIETSYSQSKELLTALRAEETQFMSLYGIHEVNPFSLHMKT